MFNEWKDCKTEFPRRRKDKNDLSELVLTYDGCFSLQFYNFARKEWKDVTVGAYISDQGGQWKYLEKP